MIKNSYLSHEKANNTSILFASKEQHTKVYMIPEDFPKSRIPFPTYLNSPLHMGHLAGNSFVTWIIIRYSVSVSKQCVTVFHALSFL